MGGEVGVGLWIEVVCGEGDSCLGGDTEGCRRGDLLRGLGDREENGGEGGEWGRLTDNGDHETLGGDAGGGEGGALAGDLLVVCPTIESMEKPSLLLISLLNSLLNRFGWFKAWWVPWKRDMVAPVIPCGHPPKKNQRSQSLEPSHQSHFPILTARCRERDSIEKSKGARSVLGAMAKTRLMFVNEAELGLGAGGAAVCAPTSPNLCTRPR